METAETAPMPVPLTNDTATDVVTSSQPMLAATPAKPLTVKSTELLSYKPSRTNLPSSPERYDQRVQWLRDTVRSSVALVDAGEDVGKMFVDCLERNDRYNLAELMDFLDGLAGQQTTVVFYVVSGKVGSEAFE